MSTDGVDQQTEPLPESDLPIRIEGPAWTAPGLDVVAGRFPLSVEQHTLLMAELLVPGITTVTPHARYYALHGLIAAEAASRRLSTPEANTLRRRAEVVMALVSRRHDHSETGRALPRAHGADALGRLVTGQNVDLASAARSGPSGFVTADHGFLGPYRASEVSLQIITDEPNPAPGPAYGDTQVRDSLGPILDLAERDTLSLAELDEHPSLCICNGADASDGEWLARLLCAVPDRGRLEVANDPDRSTRSTALDRRETLRTFAQILDTGSVTQPAEQFADRLAFGDFVTTDPVVAHVQTALVWQGAVLRNYSVGAWRRLWQWLVNQVHVAGGLVPDTVPRDAFAAAVPDATVAEFRASLPPTRLPDGSPAPAEREVRNEPGLSVPHRELALLAAGAARTNELIGVVREAFLGRYPAADLGPIWLERRMDTASAQPLREFAADLTSDLLARAERIAYRKARRRGDGTIWLPTRLHRRGDFLWASGREGGGDASLRLAELVSVLAGAGMIRRSDGVWHNTDRSRRLLNE